MATYNKRGYKAPKPKEEKIDNEFVDETNLNVDEKDSTTASVFNSLDQTASKTEEFVARNQKVIFGAVFVIAIVAVSYLLYQKFVVDANEQEANKEMFQAQKYFQQATEGVKPDSLYTLALKGGEGKYGFVTLADKYSGTDAGNLANYYAGMASLNTGKFDDAIKYLEKFKSKEDFLSALATGAIGDAHAEKKQYKEALDFYVKAADVSKSDAVRPRFLLKAGKVSLELGNKADALKYFSEIKDTYDNTQSAQNIDALIGLAQ
ncbi:tetratricopeptide repeat protein [Flavobacterium sp.]|uniref:tetratricopeptide repeat protein n=1 Tax=Flavobacterium sp. TaxID=239 RepID=UPI00261B22DD|nr:tetratricopeptide repeat protein [Flavobacterium sp.]